MKKEKILFIISVLLIFMFVIITLIDYLKYDESYSAPFAVDIFVRTLEFIIPSVIVFLIALFIKRKNKSK
jgi:hypothetical protein